MLTRQVLDQLAHNEKTIHFSCYQHPEVGLDLYFCMEYYLKCRQEACETRFCFPGEVDDCPFASHWSLTSGGFRFQFCCHPRSPIKASYYLGHRFVKLQCSTCNMVVGEIDLEGVTENEE